MLTLLIIVVAVALVFEYINGFHDTANAIATVVSTKVLTARKAIMFGAVLNFVGAFWGTHVAKTISSGLVDATIVTQPVILAALIGAIIWNLITWWYGIPSSSSHALIGGLVGAAIAKAGFKVVIIDGILHKVVYPMILSPALTFVAAFFVMWVLIWAFRRSRPDRVNRYFRKLQIFSAGFMAFSHGSNDAQKTMGIITLSLFSYGAIATNDIPFWVILVCAITMGMGTMSGGWKIIKTMGTKVLKMKPIHGFAGEFASSAVILAASNFGIPLSTTHVKASSIMGVGCVQNFSAVKWGMVGRILQAWVLTFPVCMILAAGAYKCFSVFFE